MKNLTIAGDITYFTINGEIYGIDASDNSAVHCHDENSPAERIDYVDMCNILELSDIDQTDDHDEWTTITGGISVLINIGVLAVWHFDGFDVVACGGEFYIEEHYYMNPCTGSVDTSSNWAAEGFPPTEDESLVRVVKDSDGNWVDCL